MKKKKTYDFSKQSMSDYFFEVEIAPRVIVLLLLAIPALIIPIRILYQEDLLTAVTTYDKLAAIYSLTIILLSELFVISFTIYEIAHYVKALIWIRRYKNQYQL